MLAWEKQPEESARAYEAFALYRDLGPERSLAKVGQMLGKSKALMERWSAKHDWVYRVQALEARDQMIAREAVEQHKQVQAEDHAKREARLREEALSVREEAMSQSKKMLSWPLTEQRVVQEEEDGEQVVYQFIPAKWNKGTAVSLFHLAVGNAPDPADLEEAMYEEDYSELSEAETEELLRLVNKIRYKPREN